MGQCINSKNLEGHVIARVESEAGQLGLEVVNRLLHSRPSDTPWPFWAPLGEGICSLTYKIRSFLFVDSADFCGEVPLSDCAVLVVLVCTVEMKIALVVASRSQQGHNGEDEKVWEVNWINIPCTIWTRTSGPLAVVKFLTWVEMVI